MIPASPVKRSLTSSPVKRAEQEVIVKKSPSPTRQISSPVKQREVSPAPSPTRKSLEVSFKPEASEDAEKSSPPASPVKEEG